MRAALLYCVVLIVASGSAWAGEYSQWRGPDRNGVAAPGPALASAWPEAGPPRLWHTERLPCDDNTGYGSVAVAAGRSPAEASGTRLRAPRVSSGTGG